MIAITLTDVKIAAKQWQAADKKYADEGVNYDAGTYHEVFAEFAIRIEIGEARNWIEFHSLWDWCLRGFIGNPPIEL